jgi:hypothetical protein
MSNQWLKTVCSVLLLLTNASCGSGDDSNTNANIPCPVQCHETSITPSCETGSGATDSSMKCSANLQTSVTTCSGNLTYSGTSTYTCHWTTLGGVIQSGSCDGHGSCTYP